MKAKNKSFKPCFAVLNMKKMDKSIQITLIIVGAVLFLAIAGVILFQSNSAGNTVTVQGEAVSKVAPDLITVYFSVETTGKTSKEASDANSVISDLDRKSTRLNSSHAQLCY
jgi:uncharacterized protein YggE